jgi:hypothetical protein
MEGQRIVFGQNPNRTYHAFRYTDILGLDRNAVMEAVCADLQPLLPLLFPSPDNMPNWTRKGKRDRAEI